MGTLLACLVSFIWVALRLASVEKSGGKQAAAAPSSAVNGVANLAFTDEFREELQQRAREQFEKVMNDNAMFLQQDVRVSAAQLDDFMKKEVLSTLQQELGRHHQVLEQTKRMVTDTVAKNQNELQQELAAEKQRRVEMLDERMVDVVKAYVIAAVGKTLDGDRQLALVIDNLNAHKAEIMEDIRRDG